MPQFRALVRIQSEPSVSITEIAEHLALSLSSTSRLISGLVRRQYLARESAPKDRRQTRVIITPKGSAVLQTAREATSRELQLVFESLAEGERDAIIDAMHILRRLFGPSGIPEGHDSAKDDDRNGNGRSTEIRKGAR